MLIGGDDISNDVITFGTFFLVFLYSRPFPYRADWRKSDSSVDGEPQGNWRWNSNSRERRSCKLSPPAERPVELARRRLTVNGGVTIQVKPILRYLI